LQALQQQRPLQGLDLPYLAVRAQA
jgi:hypothetical protein